MYCQECGKPISDSAKFCPYCGTATVTEELTEEKETASIQEEPKQQEEPEKIPEVKAKKKKEKKEKPKAKSKKPLIIAVALIVIIAIIAGIVIISSQQKVVAELPDPEYFFEGTGKIDEIEETKLHKRVILRSDENLWNEAAAYVNLIKWSGKYPVTQSDEERYKSGDYMWNFVYNNREEIKEPYFAQIEVSYYNKSNGRDRYAVWITINDIDAFDLAERERYQPPTVSNSNSSGTQSSNSVSNNSVANNASSGITGSGGASSSVSSSSDDDDDFEVPDASDIYDSKTQCGVCDGDGDCQTCGGDGYLMSSASDKEDRNCYGCNGTGNCRSCGGDGEL